MPNADNDHAIPVPHAVDPHGEAALLLVESLLQGLTAATLLTNRDAVGIVEVAIGAHAEIRHDRDGTTPAPRRAADLLAAIASSLRTDILHDGADHPPADRPE